MADSKDPKSPRSDAGGNSHDIFAREEVYPDPELIFRVRPSPVAQLKKSCLFVLDTNALLAPFGVGTKTLAEVGQAIRKLVDEKRLVIPSQVAREFADNRSRRLSEIYADLQNKKIRPRVTASALLESIPKYGRVAELEREVDRAWKEYSDAIDGLLHHMRGWNWDDPVSQLYRELFVGKNVVCDTSKSREEIKRDLETRQANAKPPGYKDRGKNDDGVGDLLIWHTILEVGSARSADVVFVSGDRKPDWWHQSAGAALYPRFELVAEFAAASSGRSFHMMRFTEFLELFEVEHTAVEEVRKEEERTVNEAVLAPSNVRPAAVIRKWIQDDWTGVERIDETGGFPDLELTGADKNVTAVEVQYSHQVLGGLSELASRCRRWASSSYRRRLTVVVVIAHTMPDAEQLAAMPWTSVRDLTMVFGCIIGGSFVLTGVSGALPEGMQWRSADPGE